MYHRWFQYQSYHMNWHCSWHRDTTFLLDRAGWCCNLTIFVSGKYFSLRFHQLCAIVLQMDTECSSKVTLPYLPSLIWGDCTKGWGLRVRELVIELATKMEMMVTWATQQTAAMSNRHEPKQHWLETQVSTSIKAKCQIIRDKNLPVSSKPPSIYPECPNRISRC